MYPRWCLGSVVSMRASVECVTIVLPSETSPGSLRGSGSAAENAPTPPHASPEAAATKHEKKGRRGSTQNKPRKINGVNENARGTVVTKAVHGFSLYISLSFARGFPLPPLV